MDVIHRPKSKILKILKKIKITTFRKLALLPSSDEWRGRREEKRREEKRREEKRREEKKVFFSSPSPFT
jgi:DUF4097 and DUF4098 domain-containing protein YvlB